ncbi:hypothetical protein EZV73_09625 [Acidaminobacter sp. JC074]|uniref:hypothetical protein n=1 Tax=Acidaminobacter sp. JC074 TaxID=2530199 RepID=UPI001F0D5A0C|nr:hypothetical protein [Acidaminobacter sp. JC074]MCH4887833.1 hypothetical protein [Acidaminobacter sp. JC074]
MLTYIYEAQNDWLKKHTWIRVKISEKKKGHAYSISPRGSGSTVFYFTLIAYNDLGERLPLACTSLEYGLIDVGEVVDVAVRKNRILDFRRVNGGQ